MWKSIVGWVLDPWVESQIIPLRISRSPIQLSLTLRRDAESRLTQAPLEPWVLIHYYRSVDGNINKMDRSPMSCTPTSSSPELRFMESMSNKIISTVDRLATPPTVSLLMVLHSPTWLELARLQITTYYVAVEVALTLRFQAWALLVAGWLPVVTILRQGVHRLFEARG